MKRTLLLLTIVCTMLTFVTSACNEKTGDQEEAINAQMQIAQATERNANATEQLVEALQAETLPCDVEIMGPIAWNSDDWDPDLKQEVEDLAKQTHYFGKPAFAPEGIVTAITKSLEITGLNSDASTQIVVWYQYQTLDGKSLNEKGEPLTSKMLIQGPLTQAEIEDLRTTLNKQRECCNVITKCTVLRGGCFMDAPKCKPLKDPCVQCDDKPLKTNEKECEPCNKSKAPYGSSVNQGDGISPQQKATGSDKTLQDVKLILP